MQIDDALVERLRTDQVYLLARPKGHDAKNIEYIIESLGQAAAAALEAAGLSREGLREALEQMVEEKCDYMRINNLGDPEAQHTIKAARKALALGGDGEENPPLDPTAD